MFRWKSVLWKRHDTLKFICLSPLTSLVQAFTYLFTLSYLKDIPRFLQSIMKNNFRPLIMFCKCTHCRTIVLSTLSSVLPLKKDICENDHGTRNVIAVVILNVVLSLKTQTCIGFAGQKNSESTWLEAMTARSVLLEFILMSARTPGLTQQICNAYCERFGRDQFMNFYYL